MRFSEIETTTGGALYDLFGESTPRSSGIAFEGCRRGYGNFETFELQAAMGDKDSDSGGSRSNYSPGVASYSASRRTLRENDRNAVVSSSSTSSAASPLALSMKTRGLNRLTRAAAVKRVDLVLTPDDLRNGIGGPKGAFSRCVIYLYS